MEASPIQQCQEIIGYTFRDPSMLRLALTHASVAPSRLESNERLEFLGDAVLGLVICQELYRRFGNLLEGQMTKVKSAVVSRRACAEVALEIGIDQMLLTGKGMAVPDGLPQSVAAAVLEAIIGAIYLDGGLEPARRFIIAHLGARLDRAMAEEHQRNYKAVLQQHSQRLWGLTPDYQVLDEKGPDHSKCFEVGVSIGGRSLSTAWGMSKKEAEQEAARRALVELGLVPDRDESQGQEG